MSLAFTRQLGLKTQKSSIGAQKINSTTLKTYEMIVFIFFILDKDNRERFFKKSFILTDIKLDIVLRIFFLIINNTNIDFQAQNLK